MYHFCPQRMLLSSRPDLSDLSEVSFTEFLDASVSYSLASLAVTLDDVFFPSVTICNMNTMRRSFIVSLARDPKLEALNVSYPELKKVIHLVFIAGEDYKLNKRESQIVESNS